MHTHLNEKIVLKTINKKKKQRSRKFKIHFFIDEIFLKLSFNSFKNFGF